jgi:(p)ppGpp synthase/HD superfamily hydrolase
MRDQSEAAPGWNDRPAHPGGATYGGGSEPVITVPSAYFTRHLAAALNYAVGVHGKQVRKETTIPYISHLLAVTALVIEHGGDEDQAVAALLHDAIEDQPRNGRTREDIGKMFGERVLEIVLGCTDAQTEPKPPWRERKEAYLAHLATASLEVRRVAAADKLHNARAILADYRRLGGLLWKRFNATADDQVWYYRSIVIALRSGEGSGAIRGLVDELDEVVQALEAEVGYVRRQGSAT